MLYILNVLLETLFELYSNVELSNGTNTIKINTTDDGYWMLYLKNFKLYLFYNNNTRLQIGHEVILLGGEWIQNIFRSGKTIEFPPRMKTLTYSCRLWDSNPRPPSNSVVVIDLTPRLAHHLNLSASELW